MKTLKLLALLAVCGLVLPVLAEDTPPEVVAGPLFLAEASPACSGPSATPTPAVLDGLQGAVARSSCNATASCGVHPDVSCSGTSTCTSEDRNCDAGANGFVTCDGVTTTCPHSQSCLNGCAAAWEQCVSQCPPGILNPCRTACSSERGLCHCNC